MSHVLGTKHQADSRLFQVCPEKSSAWQSCYYRRLQNEVGAWFCTLEIQHDWYRKRGISLYGFLLIAQVDGNEKRTEVIDL